MTKLGERLIANVREARAELAAKGLDAFRIHHPPDVKAIRTKLDLTQQAFAARFGLPLGSVRDWEQGRVVPDQAAQVLLRVIEAAPDLVAKVATA